MRKSNSADKSYVYCISVSTLGPCKIGYALNPWTRLSSLQSGNHQDLALSLVCCPAELKVEVVEGKLHRAFYKARLRGEWFAVSVEEIAVAMAAFGEVKADPKFPPPPPKSEEDLMRAMQFHPRYNGSMVIPVLPKNTLPHIGRRWSRRGKLILSPPSQIVASE